MLVNPCVCGEKQHGSSGAGIGSNVERIQHLCVCVCALVGSEVGGMITAICIP